MSRCAAGVEPLTRTEGHVLALVDSGFSNREIAATLSITVGTVKCNLHRVYEKLQVTSRLAAVAKAREHADLSSSVRTTASVRAPVLPSNFGFGR
jgi:LuxR family transcriptional regulator, maltose regulon positive regulatory protein